MVRKKVDRLVCAFGGGSDVDGAEVMDIAEGDDGFDVGVSCGSLEEGRSRRLEVVSTVDPRVFPSF
jgi:hypothetical protein